MNVLISYPDKTLSATLSGGSWQSTAPLNNLKDEKLSKITRSTNALATSSIILEDLGSAQAVRVVSLCRHNIKAGGTIRVRGYSDSGYTTLVTGADTGTLPVWPVSFTAQDVIEHPKNWTFCFDSSKTARYWKTEIVDTTNSDGFISAGRMWLGDATFYPNIGIAYGATLGYESRDVVDESIGGVINGEQREPRRTLGATFEALTVIEKRKALILQKQLTSLVECFWVTDTSAVAEDMLLEAFPCYIRRANPIAYPYIDNNEMVLEIVEKI